MDFDLNDILSDIANNPDMLDDLTQEDSSDQLEGFDYVNFLQKQSALAGHDYTPVGMIAVGRKVEIDNEKVWRGVILESLQAKFWIIDPILRPNGVYQGKTQWVGDRSMWPVLANGQRDPDGKEPVCKSSDSGLNPHARFVGKIVSFPSNHPYSGQRHMIGYRLNEDGSGLVPEEIGKICERCPLGMWTTYQGKQRPPLCGESWNIVIWFPPQPALELTGDRKNAFRDVEWKGGLAVLQGSNTSIQLAIKGVPKADSKGATMDGRSLPSLMSFREQRDTYLKVVPKDSLPAAQRGLVIGMSAVEKPNSDDTYVAFKDAENVDALWKDKKLPYAVLSIPTFPWANAGLPEHVGSEALDGLRFLTMELVQNKYTNNPFVPLFALSEAKVTAEDYGLFYAARKQYRDEDRKATMRFESNVPMLEGKLGMSTPALGSGMSEHLLTGGDPIEEAEFDDPDELD